MCFLVGEKDSGEKKLYRSISKPALLLTQRSLLVFLNKWKCTKSFSVFKTDTESDQINILTCYSSKMVEATPDPGDSD